MKTLKDIPKKNPFTVPDGYFDRLPGQIQARIQVKEQPVYIRYSLRLAVPALFVLAVAVYLFSPFKKDQEASSLLKGIETEDLITYLSESDVTIDLLVENGGLSQEELGQLENTIYFNSIGDSPMESLTLELE